jgi:hypothetical protein
MQEARDQQLHVLPNVDNDILFGEPRQFQFRLEKAKEGELTQSIHILVPPRTTPNLTNIRFLLYAFHRRITGYKITLTMRDVIFQPVGLFVALIASFRRAFERFA